MFAIIPYFKSLIVSSQQAAGIVPCGGNGEPLCNLCDIVSLGNNIVEFLLFKLALPLVVLTIIFAGIEFLSANGNPGKIETGKKAFRMAILGLLIAFCAWLIVDFVLGILLDKSYIPIWNKFPECPINRDYIAPTPSIQTPSIAQQPQTPPTASLKPFSDGASPELAVFNDCLKKQIPSAIITSVTDTHISAGTCSPTDPNEKFSSSSDCQHARYSCHYGGRNCASKGGYALDVRSSNLDFSTLAKAAAACNTSARCNNESTGGAPHYHVSIGSAYNCGCDDGLPSCK